MNEKNLIRGNEIRARLADLKTQKNELKDSGTLYHNSVSVERPSNISTLNNVSTEFLKPHFHFIVTLALNDIEKEIISLEKEFESL